VSQPLTYYVCVYQYSSEHSAGVAAVYDNPDDAVKHWGPKYDFHRDGYRWKCNDPDLTIHVVRKRS
jgi:hypothetical protein